MVQTSYTASGYPETLTRESDGYVYQHIAATNKWGQATLVYEGGSQASTAAVMVTRVEDPSTGLLTSLTAENPQTNATLAQVSSDWDGFGNLTSRTAGGSTETATYDKLNRLIGSLTTLTGGGGSVTRSYSYDSTGNRTQACENTSCTGFSYDGTGIGTNGAGPHAVTAVTLPGGTVHGSNYYAYNAKGEMTTDNDRTLSWSAFGQAESITQNQTTVHFSYGPGESRYQKVVTGPANETVTYLGGAEVLDVGGNTSIRRTMGLAGLSVIDTGGTNAGVHFGMPDHLGSMMALIDSSGSVTQGLSYGDFGKRYTTGWGGVLSYSQGWTVNTTLTDKGYTGQESLDSVGLDDYNARLYDPSLGRFLSTDPMIAHPGSTQSINPYSYVENNPLNKTDPTGQASEVGRCSLSSSCVTTNSVTIVGRGGSTSIGSGGPSTDKTKKTSSTVAKAKRIEGAIAYGKKLANKRNTISSNASFNPNTHSQSSGSSGAGSPDTVASTGVAGTAATAANDQLASGGCQSDCVTLTPVGHVVADKTPQKSITPSNLSPGGNISNKGSGGDNLVGVVGSFYVAGAVIGSVVAGSWALRIAPGEISEGFAAGDIFAALEPIADIGLVALAAGGLPAAALLGTIALVGAVIYEESQSSPKTNSGN